MTEPKRLVDTDSDDSDLLRTLFRAGRSDLPEEARLAAIADRLDGSLPAGDPTAYASAGAERLKVVGSLAVIAVGLGVWMHMHRATARATPGQVLPPPPNPIANVTAIAIATSGETVAPAPSADIMSALAPAPATSATRDARPARRATSHPGSGPLSAGSLDGETELALLQEAEGDLRADPAEALAVAARHEARFPHGALVQEREVIAIDALVRLGRVEDARARASRFVKDFASSAHRTRVETLVREGGDSSDHNP
jgi:hypothetical protein